MARVGPGTRKLAGPEPIIRIPNIRCIIRLLNPVKICRMESGQSIYLNKWDLRLNSKRKKITNFKNIYLLIFMNLSKYFFCYFSLVMFPNAKIYANQILQFKVFWL